MYVSIDDMLRNMVTTAFIKFGITTKVKSKNDMTDGYSYLPFLRDKCFHIFICVGLA